MRRLFITATDTDAGKTHIAQAIVHLLVKHKQKVAVFKPVSAGCEWQNGELVNEDARLLMAQANAKQSYQSVNPIAFEEPIAPHIAAQSQNIQIDLAILFEHYQGFASLNVDYIVTEGAGGWRLPLGNGKFLSELATSTQQDVILVVNMKLGCLNHALLTAEAIARDGLKLVGWVANAQSDMPYLDENVQELIELLPCPILGFIKNEPDICAVAQQLELSLISG